MNAFLSKKWSKYVSFFGLMLIVSFCSPAFSLAANGRIESNVTVHSATTTLSNTEWHSLSLAAVNIMKQADQAWWASMEQNKAEALKDLEQAQTLVKIIEATVPPVNVDVEIKAGDLTYKDSDSIYNLRIPVYNELTHYDIVSPVIRAKKLTQPNVLRAGVDYSTEYLDIPLTNHYLEAAHNLVQQEKWQGAIASIDTIFSTAVVFETIDYELPLSRAAHFIGLSQQAYKDGRYDLSERMLRQASDYMSDYIKTVKTKERVLLERYRQSMDDMADIIHDESRRMTLGTKLSDLWHDMTSHIRR